MLLAKCWVWIATHALITEFAIAAPEKFAEFNIEHTRKDKLGVFAAKCHNAIHDSPNIHSPVQAPKKSGKPLPVWNGKC